MAPTIPLSAIATFSKATDESRGSNSLHTLYARDEENSMIGIVTIVTSLIGVVVAIIGLIQGFKCLKRRRNRATTQDPGQSAGSQSPAAVTVNDNIAIYIYSVLMPVSQTRPAPERDAELVPPVISTIEPALVRELGDPAVG